MGENVKRNEKGIWFLYIASKTIKQGTIKRTHARKKHVK